MQGQTILHTPPVVIGSDDAITLSDDDLPIPTRKSLKTEAQLIEILTPSINISDNE